MKQNANKARGLAPEELAKQLGETAEQMFRIRFQLGMGQAEGVKKLRELRKERARMLTIQREKELGLRATAPAPAGKKAKPVKAASKPQPKAAAPKVKKAAAQKPAAAGAKPAAKPRSAAPKKEKAAK